MQSYTKISKPSQAQQTPSYTWKGIKLTPTGRSYRSFENSLCKWKKTLYHPVKNLRSLLKYCFYYSKNKTLHLLNTMPQPPNMNLFSPQIRQFLQRKMTGHFLPGKSKMTTFFCESICFIKITRSSWLFVSSSFVVRASKFKLLSSIADYS